MSAVGYLGPPGTHSHEALGGEDGLPLPTIPDVVAAVATGDLEAGLVPLENSTEGGVGATLDALVEAEGVTIVGEVVWPVAYALVAASAVELPAISTVVSHPQALAQCARWLRENLPDASPLPAASTADAVRAVSGEAAALGTPLAARLHGGVVLREGIADEPGNATRFVRIARAPADGPHDKTSVAWWGAGDESPGWLVRCLSEFAFRGVNLSRIESRPHRQSLGHYRFFADLEGGASDRPVAEAIAALGNHAESVRVLGSYVAAPGYTAATP